MIDFGTAKIIKDYTSTFIGTPHYIAPEIILGKGYNFSCDFWSLGICMYEIFYCRYPFGNKVNDVIDIYKEVLNKNLFLPNSSTVDVSSTNELLKLLLTKKVNERLCDVPKLKKKVFFKDFDFDKLNDLKLEPPFRPEKEDFSQYFNEQNPYENIVQKDIKSNKKKCRQNVDYPSEYDPNWADVF